VRAEGLAPLESEEVADQSVVAHLGVCVERQVVGDEGQVGLEQVTQPRLHLLGHAQGRSAPQDAVVAEHHLGTRLCGALEQLAMGRDPGHDDAHLLGAGDLEPVRPVVLEAGGFEQGVEECDDLVSLRHGRHVTIAARQGTGSGRGPDGSHRAAGDFRR
jgi:hypothetical protein